MSVPIGNRRPSWRQAGTRPVAAAGSVTRRRLLASALLMCLLLGAIALVAFLANRRYQHTRVASLFTASRSQTGEPEQPYTWPPLRFGSESLAPLLAEKKPQFELASLTTRFVDAKELQAEIEGQIRGLERDDAFILWIRAKGASLADQAYLFSGEYRLPQSGEQLSSPQGAIPFKTIVDAVSQWQGPSMILLDWGNQLSDPRAGVWDNQFLDLAIAEIAAAPPRVHCLVSHQYAELSLDSLSSQQTLFGRACAEALVGPRRAPPDFSSQVSDHRQLLVGDLAEYVIRRVWTDSAGTQKPWLAKGGTGWLDVKRDWDSLTTSPLLQLGANRRPLGWSDFEAAAPQEDSQATASAEEPPQDPSPAVVELTDENWPTGTLWQSLDQWRAPSDELGGWSLASLAPLTARRMATKILYLEQRWMAGDDFRSEANLLDSVSDLRRELSSQKDDIERASYEGTVSSVFKPLPANVSPNEIADWRRRIETVAAYRQLALSLSDTIALADSISMRQDVSRELSRAAGRGIAAVESFLHSLSGSSREPIDNLPMLDTARLGSDLKVCKEQIDVQIASLVKQVVDNPLKQKPLAELLSRYCWLSHAQRSELWRSMVSAKLRDANSEWPTKNLSSLQVNQPPDREVVRPQTLGLVKALSSELFDGSVPAAATAQDLVTILGRVADAVRDSNQVSEAQWLVVDGRDLCQIEESRWPVGSQQPPLPSVPQPLPSWRVAWENAVGGQLDSNRLQLDSTSEPASLDLMLTRIGAAVDIDSIEIRFHGVEGRIAGSDAPWGRGSLQLAQSDLLRVVVLKANAQRLPIEIRALSNEPNIKRELQVHVNAGSHSPAEQHLACQLPVAIPVTLAVQQRVCREGETKWENCVQHGTLFTMQPFPGRRTEFRLLVSNQDDQARTASVELYRLNSRSASNAKGRISVTGDEVPMELENQVLGSLTSIARSAAIDLGPNQSDVEVDFSTQPSPPADPNAATSDQGNDGQPATTTAAPSQPDIAWGMLAVVRLKSEPTQAWRTWLQLKPVMADDFLSKSTKNIDGRTIELEVGLKDENGNNIPDWTPTDYNDEHPIVVQCAIGDGIDLREAILSAPLQNLTKDKPRSVFALNSEREIQNEVEFQVDVDGSVRAMFAFVGVGGRAARREPPDRIAIRSIGVKDGLTYLNRFQRNLGEKERLLDKFGAMFRRPINGTVEIELAIDSQSRRLVGTPPIEAEFQLKGPTWEHSFGHFYGARDLHANLVEKPGTTLSVACQLTDWRFSWAPQPYGDVTATFRGRAGASGERTLAKLVVDGLGPKLVQSVPAQEILQGKSGQLSFEVDERVPIGQAKIQIYPTGKPNQVVSLVEGLSDKDFDPSPSGWRLRSQTLPVQEYPPGRYELRVQIEDILGNPANLGAWELTIQPKPLPNEQAMVNGAAAAPPLKGDVNGRVFFGTVNKKSPKPVTVSVKDQPDKTVVSEDGKFTIAGLEAGEYTIEAQTKWQNVVYKGEAKVKLVKKADYQKMIDITLTK
ncbi:MAG: carboxypeptidase regulatory-like domain-containing protein [Pirellulaceae bacterium]|nr:carboxypeptidase regulatory-like domain-containing protein [Pirellulaceae bacterium]